MSSVILVLQVEKGVQLHRVFLSRSKTTLSDAKFPTGRKWVSYWEELQLGGSAPTASSALTVPPAESRDFRIIVRINGNYDRTPESVSNWQVITAVPICALGELRLHMLS